MQLKKSTWDDRQVVDRKTGKAVKRVVEEKQPKPDKRQKQQGLDGAGFGGGYYHNR